MILSINTVLSIWKTVFDKNDSFLLLFSLQTFLVYSFLLGIGNYFPWLRNMCNFIVHLSYRLPNFQMILSENIDADKRNLYFTL